MKNSLRFATALFMCYAVSGAFAQNLVLNPSFETTSACPQGISQFYLATNWDDGNSGADSCTTSDLYASCSSTIGGANSPNGLLGYQPSRTGSHHAGIILGEGFVGCIPIGSNYREYIQGTLSSALVAGQRYVVSFYVSLPEDVMWGSNSLGVYFSNTQYQHNACPNNQLMPLTPQLEMCGSAVMDTINWVQIKWIYTATGGERYFTIGNFRNDNNTNRVSHDCASFNPYIYYYIDDVSITSYQVGSNECGISVQTDSTNAMCGASNGSASVLARTCASPLTYAWSNGATTAINQNIPAGTYQLTITDAQNCQQTVAVTVNATPLAVSVTSTNPACGSTDGTATVTPTNGTGPFNYNWSNGGNTQTINSLAAGNYNVTITGAPGCSATAIAYLTGASGLTLTPSSTSASCSGNNGTASVTVSGGSAPYMYSWSNGQTTQTISGLSAGTYSVTVQGDTAGAVFFSEDFTSGGTGWTLNIDGPGTNAANANRWIVNNNSSCTCGTGNRLHITCDPALFFCILTPGECTYFPGPALSGDPTADKFVSSPDISTLGKSNMTLRFNYSSAGEANVDYGLVRLSDNGGASWTDLPTRYQNVTACSQAVITIPALYENKTNFKIAFRWINNANGTGDDPGFTVDDVQLSYVPSNCPATATVTVGTTNGLTLVASSVAASCGQNNGSATATVTAGSGPYTYLWNTGATTQTISNLGTGLYEVTVTGAGGCSATASTSIPFNSGVSATTTSTNATCGNTNGSAQVTAGGGNGTYTYLWNNNATTASLSNIAGGTYTVTVSSAGCSVTASVTVSTTGAVTATTSTTNAGCTSTGSATVNPSGGTGTFSYLWSNGGTTATISNLSGGNYTVTVSSGGCNTTASAVVASTGGVTLVPSSTNTTCGANNGSASVNATTGASPFNYAWNNGGTAASISNVAGGTYIVTVTDANGCSATMSAHVDSSFVNPAVITVDKLSICSGDSAYLCAPDTFTNYLWNTGQNTRCIYAKLAGNYYLTATESSGCPTSSNRISLNVLPLPPVSISVNGDTLTAYNSVTYQWYRNGVAINGATANRHIATQSGDYTVAVTDSNGCRAVSSKVNIITTGINDVMREPFVKVYPNPLEFGMWNLEVPNNLIGSEVEVFDAEGRLVYKLEIQRLKTELDLQMASGVYIMRINSPFTTITNKLIKL